jgi:hypothetical protein
MGEGSHSSAEIDGRRFYRIEDAVNMIGDDLVTRSTLYSWVRKGRTPFGLALDPCRAIFLKRGGRDDQHIRREVQWLIPEDVIRVLKHPFLRLWVTARESCNRSAITSLKRTVAYYNQTHATPRLEFR